MAYALPFHYYAGRPSKGENANLHGLFLFLKNKKFIDENKFENALKNGWCFRSSIPEGEGLGSSGALTACLYKEFGQWQGKSISEIRADLGAIESYFHGTSSGIDPIVSFLATPVLIKQKILSQKLYPIDFFTKLENSNLQLILVNSGIKRKASAFIKDFCQSSIYTRDFFEKKYNPVNDSCIESVLSGSIDHLWDNFKNLCVLQLDCFSPMFPAKVLAIKKDFKGQLNIKLCGAGGGGHYLILAKNLELLTLQNTYPELEFLKLDPDTLKS
jgi:mevalonate kinase